MDPILNFAKSNVNQGYDDSAVEIALVTGGGAKFPSPATDGAFNLVWYNSSDYGDPADDPNVEIVRCTARSTDTLTITRAQESTGASTKNTADKTYIVVLAPTEKTMDDVLARTNHTGVQAGTTVELTDAGDYYTGTETEAALQEVGLALTGKAAIAQTFYIGTTQVAINRASDTLNLAGIGTLGVGAITSSGTLVLGANNITTTGSLGATGAGKLTKIWAVNTEITNLPTINGGTLATALSLSGTNTGDEVVATGAELDTGTDNVKYASAKAIKDSHNVPSVAPSTDGNVLTSNGTDWVSEAATGGASQLSELSDVVSATNTDKFALMANGSTGYVGRALVEADISDLGTYVTAAEAITAVEGEATLVFSGSISLGGHAFDDIDITAEFVDTDDHIMSSKAIKAKIEDYGYSTEVGTVTAVTGTGAISSTGGTTPEISIATANTTTTGALTDTDWDTFNDKAEANQTFYIGTTQVAINRASASLTLAGLTLTTPNLGTPSALIGTNISGTGANFTAGSVTNATFTTALTVNTGTLTLTADGGNDSVLTIGGGAVSVSGTNTGDNTVATALTGTPSITVANIVTTGTIDLGHADDTTIARASAGVVSIQGSDILVSGGALGTPSGGTLTNCTGLPVSGLANGTDGELITWAADASATTVAAGTADQVLTSNGAGAAPTFQDAVGDINEETGTTYTLVLGDAPRGTVRCTNANAITLTVPKNSVVAFPTGTTIAIVQGGAGQVTISPVDGDVTLESYDTAVKLVGQYAGAVLIKRDTDTWILEGNLEA